MFNFLLYSTSQQTAIITITTWTNFDSCGNSTSSNLLPLEPILYTWTRQTSFSLKRTHFLQWQSWILFKFSLHQWHCINLSMLFSRVIFSYPRRYTLESHIIIHKCNLMLFYRYSSTIRMSWMHGQPPNPTNQHLQHWLDLPLRPAFLPSLFTTIILQAIYLESCSCPQKMWWDFW